MNSIASIAMSGMNAAQLHMSSAAHNIANSATAGFKRQLVDQKTLPEGGVAATISQASTEGSSMVEDLVGQLIARYQFIANLRVIQTEDRLMGALLDTEA